MNKCTIKYVEKDNQYLSSFDGTPIDMLFGLAHLVGTLSYHIAGENAEQSVASQVYDATVQYLSDVKDDMLKEIIREDAAETSEVDMRV